MTRGSTLIALTMWTLAALVGGAAIAWSLKPAPDPAPEFTPVAITVSTCGSPQWVVFASAGGWSTHTWAVVRARQTLTQRYLARERVILNMGCPGGHR